MSPALKEVCKDCDEWLSMYLNLLEEHFHVLTLVEMEQATQERLERLRDAPRKVRL